MNRHKIIGPKNSKFCSIFFYMTFGLAAMFSVHLQILLLELLAKISITGGFKQISVCGNRESKVFLFWFIFSEDFVISWENFIFAPTINRTPI